MAPELLATGSAIANAGVRSTELDDDGDRVVADLTRLDPAPPLTAQVAPSAQLSDIGAGDRKALSRPLRVCAADGASVDRRERIGARSRTDLGAGCRLAELLGNTLGDACRREWVRADESEQSKDTPEREHRSELPRNQKLSPAGVIRDGRRWLRDEQRRQLDRFGLVDPFGHALPQFLCQIVHAGVCRASR